MNHRRKWLLQLSTTLFLISSFSLCHATPIYDDLDDPQSSSEQMDQDQIPNRQLAEEDNTPTISALGNKNMATRLQQILPAYRAAITNPWPTIPDSPRILKPGSKNKTVLILRERLIRSNDLTSANNSGKSYYDKGLASGVKIFQARHGLKADGIVGAGTRDQLNIPPEIRARQIEANIERWNDLSPNLGHRYIMVNIPEYLVHVIDDDKEVLSIKAIVGKPDWPTPELSSRITRIIFNPPWNVPVGIAKRDIAPKMLKDPSYLRTNHIRIFASSDEGSEELSSREIDWESAAENGFPYQLRQDPGAKNALGLVKFEFPNKKDVYLHDTPAKALFAQDTRDFSHGCVRLEKPFSLVEYLIQDDSRINNDKIQEILAAGRSRAFSLKNPLPIFITYLTAWVNDDGTVNFRDDVYHQDTDAPQADGQQNQHVESDSDEG